MIDIEGTKQNGRQTLQNCAFWQELTERERLSLCSPVGKRFYEKQSVIVGFDDSGQYRSMFLVIRGSVSMMLSNAEGRRVLFLKLGRGEGNFLFGDLKLSDGTCIEYVAEKGTELWFYPNNVEKDGSDGVIAFVRRHESCRKTIVRLLDLIADITFHPLKDRLVKQLQIYARERNSNEIAITHEALANDLGSSREVISRLLKQLEDMGTIALGRKKIVLLEGLSNKEDWA